MVVNEALVLQFPLALVTVTANKCGPAANVGVIVGVLPAKADPSIVHV